MPDLNHENFTCYEKLKENFNHNGVTIGSYEVDQEGNDFDGFDVEIEGILSNSIEFSYSHDNKGHGEFKARTRKKSEIYKTYFELSEICNGYSEVLETFLISVLDFNF